MTKSRSKKAGRGFASSHQRSWLWGRHAVNETLSAGRWPILELMLDEEQRPELLEEFDRLAAASGIIPQKVPIQRITELCHAEDHQGVLARLAEFPLGTANELIQASQECVQRMISDEVSATSSPLFVICDRIQDAHNFGAILRCCDGMKVNGVIIGERAQAAISAHVVRSSAGAVNHVQIYQVPHLTTAVDELRQSGFQVAAATEKSNAAAWQINLKGPTVLVIGSEAFGIADELLERCSLKLTIPMLGRVTSLNAAVAAGILLYEIRRQQSLSIS